MLKPGTLILERYTIKRLLSKGGMSRVYLASVASSDTEYVVKEVFSEESGDSYETLSLKAEIEALKELTHPGLISITDAVIGEDRVMYVMKRVEGISLEDAIEDPAFMITTDMVEEWAAEIADVTGYLHSRGIYYRDLKPANIMIGVNGRITLIDLGTAWIPKTGTGVRASFGTDLYAAPEQYEENGAFDERTDIFGFGRTMLCALRHARGDAQRRGALKRLFEKCCEKDRERRFGSMEEVYYELIHIEGGDTYSRASMYFGTAAFVALCALTLLFLYMWWEISVKYAYGAAVFFTAAVCLYRFAGVKAAVFRLSGVEKERALARIRESLEINRLMNIDEFAGEEKSAVSWEDIFISYSDKAGDILIGRGDATVRIRHMNGFVIEQDITFTGA